MANKDLKSIVFPGLDNVYKIPSGGGGGGDSYISQKHGYNMYDAEHNSSTSGQYVTATVFMGGYSGPLMISCSGNCNYYAATATVYYYGGYSESINFGSRVNGSNRNGKPLTIPENAEKIEFTYRASSSGGPLIWDVMATKGSAVPEYYEAYEEYNVLDNSHYIEFGEIYTYVYVKPAADGGDDTHDGLSPDTAFASIGKALSVSGNVFIKRGSYNESLVVSDQNNIFLLPYDNDAEYDVSEPYRDMIIVKGASFTRCNNLHIEDICSKDSGGNGFYFNQCMDVYLLNCEANNATANGFQADNTNIIFDRCTAYHCGHGLEAGGDGFNFHSYGQSIMRDCNSIDSHDDGCSHHNGCHGTIIGGNFLNNTGKGGVTPAYGSDVNIIGAYFEGNRIGLDYLSFAGNHPMTANVICCAFVDNIETGIVASSLCTINAINCAFSGNTQDTGGGGTINVYNCAAASP